MLETGLRFLQQTSPIPLDELEVKLIDLEFHRKAFDYKYVLSHNRTKTDQLQEGQLVPIGIPTICRYT